MTALDTSPPLTDLGRQTRGAARQLATLSNGDRHAALEAIATALEAATPEILAANAADCEAAIRADLPKALYARLQLSPSKLKAAIAGVRDVAKLPDPLGHVQIHRELDQGLILKRITCPLGVLGIIFEARPDALIQITSLAIKSGNGVILKGGSEALQSCQTLTRIIHKALTPTAVPADAVQLLTTRAEIRALLTLEDYVDLIIPRGSNEFVRYIQDNTRIPVLGHADGICHLYIDQFADLEMAIALSLDAKTQYPAACNAIETLLIHEAIAPQLLPPLVAALEARGVELRGDEETRAITPMAAATDGDWATEYSDLILAIKIVPDLAAALDHINTYGSKHTEAIVTEEGAIAQQFQQNVDAAGVFHNCSTRFADGFRYGFGAEVGISTAQIPPRGPVGLEGLITYKYQLTGNGHIAATYSGDQAKPFTHRDLP